MYYIFICLGLGIIFGYLCPLSAKWVRVTHFITMAGLFIMLISMGAQLGGNEKVLTNLSRIGFQAIILAGCSVLGSVVLVYLAKDYIYKGLDEKLTWWQRR